MPHECFDDEQVSTVFIQMSVESMTERMAGEPLLPAKAPFMGMDMSGEKESINRTVFPRSALEKGSPRGFWNG